MHRALLLPDVLLEIFGSLRFPDRRLSWRCFAALATTCKAFHEPAMNGLWADIEDLDALLGCVTRLHPIIYQKSTYFHGWSSQGLEPLSELEAHQFLRHATRVCSIRIESDTHFHLLSIFPNETCLFPRLMSVSFMLQHPTNYWHLFLSPMLRCCYQESIHTDFISRCAVLEHLLIESFDQDIADELSSLSDSVRSCKRLVTLTGPPLDLAAWEHLSNLHTLVGVVIGKTGRRISSPKLDLNNHNLNFAPFLNLATLYFRSDTAVYITTLMQHSEFPSLKEFSMDGG
ncbi:hypothetical protein DFJ58DRAFT_63192 [Suillus subalutaceus]|uniref:uncharacterized protein n=1 Tax=Suillus subalutaceus TaxID=48586 RepID=UPI001B881CEF|nr:uncharacterized protein DFJ58DRAFT_63192 [Suillus subalutaceus]KAG1869398.1 hypothetical protein DFJ58DRAFT_63192 [Suillus subalutaceus]